ncbi:hypothetical protein OROHE_002801 [Orobanche hederae]
MAAMNGEGAAKVEAKNLTWTPIMDTYLIECLIDEANQGRKVDKSFRKSSFTQAAKEVSAKCNLNCTVLNVDNRMKTIRKNFKELKKFESNNSGMSWDNDKKMWKCSEEVCKAYILAHPKAKPYINKEIFIYDELHIICGDNQATGSFAKSSADDIHENEYVVDLENDDFPMPPNETQVNINSMASLLPAIRKHGNGNGKCGRSIEECIENIEKLACSVESIADAIKLTNNQEYTTSFLYSEVMKIEGFTEETLEDAFDYLNENDKVAIGHSLSRVLPEDCAGC